MKNLKNYFLLIGTISILIVSCSKKTSEVKPDPIIPPISEVPPTSPFVTGLTVSQSLNQASPFYDLESSIVYTSSTQNTTTFKPLPATYNDKIKSFSLPKGYMAVFSENLNGTGESICYVAAVSDVKQNLPARLVGKVSYVRFVPIKNVKKKGMCQTNINDVNALKGSWFYNWGLSGVSSDLIQYVPMTWGKNAGSTANALTFASRRDIDHLLTFNEPDNSNQSNMPDIDDAVTRYKYLLQAGLRMGSPAVEEAASTGATRWLQQFMTAADAQKARVDVVALHWYDWGGFKNDQATDQLTADAVLTRFKAYVTKLHAAYPDQALWFTEYNCNPNRSAEVHIIFMKASAAYLNALPYVERYSYFFPNLLPPTSGAPDYTLTPMGQTWFDIVSPSAFTNNIIPN